MSADTRRQGPRRVTFHGGTAEVRRAGKPWVCEVQNDYLTCWGTILPGEEYVRSVMFPNHDASGYDVPIVRVTCAKCALAFLYLNTLDVSFRRTTRL